MCIYIRWTQVRIINFLRQHFVVIYHWLRSFHTPQPAPPFLIGCRAIQRPLLLADTFCPEIGCFLALLSSKGRTVRGAVLDHVAAGSLNLSGCQVCACSPHCKFSSQTGESRRPPGRWTWTWKHEQVVDRCKQVLYQWNTVHLN